MGSTSYKVRGIVEVEGHEFDYSATLYFGDDYKPDEFEITPVDEKDEALLEEIWDTVEEMASMQAHEQYWKEQHR